MCFSRKNAPSVPAALRRAAAASSTRFSLPENWRRRPIAKTSGSRRVAPEAASAVALRAPSVTASEEKPTDPFIELFGDALMCMSYLYSKLPETGVPHHIGTEGSPDRPNPYLGTALAVSPIVKPRARPCRSDLG